MPGSPPLIFVLWALIGVAAAGAQTSDFIGLPVTEVRIEQEGQAVADRLLRGLIGTTVGEPLSMRDVRETIDHLYGLGRFDDIQVIPERSGAGVRLTYVLVPRHAVQAVEFRGRLGLPEQDLRQAMTERFGALPSAARVNEVARALVDLYRQRGFVGATVEPRVEELHDPDRAVITFTMDAGTRAPIQRVEIEGLEGPDRVGLLSEVEARPGRPYDSVALQRRLARYESDLRGRGYYEARATHRADFTPGGQAVVTISVDRGPRVSVAFAGDPLPQEVREELVPLRREGSVEEDLLEDAERGIEEYLHGRGYRDADVRHTRAQKGDELVITFTVSRGSRHVLDRVEIRGNRAVPAEELRKLVPAETGEPFVETAVDRGVDAITQTYRARGFTRARVEPLASVLPRPAGSLGAADRRVELVLTVDEGPRTVIGSIVLQGNTVFSEGQIRELMATTPGRPYSEVEVAQDRDRLQLQYLNLGYEGAVVTPQVTLSDGDTHAEVRFSISEGPQVLVDHIIIIGNRRTSTETIERALLLEPGEPLGYAARIESQQRLAALGLFRRFRITDLRHGSEPRRDILVEVEEAPPTTVGYGGGFEVVNRLRPTGPDRQAEERLELAPRGFVEVGRRNLFGKNRSVNLFARVGLKTRDADVDAPVQESDYGFNEYRVVTAYREPRVFDTPVDVLVTGTLDQAIRSSFNFRSRELRGEAGLRLAQRYGISGRYSFEQNELFDERFTEEDKPLIDRLFPEVRLSKVSLSVFRDTRNDALDPDRGTFLSADNDLAARALGSEVGFVKTFLQAATFRRLPAERRVVVRLRGIVGLAQGFERPVEQVDDDGLPIVGPDGRPVTVFVEDLPASERFFAGGDTSVRGFSLDRLGTAQTITPSGFPRGGNGLLVLNGEVLVNVWRALDVVGFLDGGNVFPRVADMDVTDLRAAAGFGLRYRSPVGPVRIDLGFNLEPRELVRGSLERRSVLHVSLGQAF
ncbi:MAG: POTRA domain-containing protein [Vicinamibacterales bacterium]